MAKALSKPSRKANQARIAALATSVAVNCNRISVDLKREKRQAQNQTGYTLSDEPRSGDNHAVLLDVKKDGKTIPAVLQTRKHSLLFLFNRLTGEPINGYEERPIPQI